MVTLVVIGFFGGLVAGISPCVLPVLPVVFAAGATDGLDDRAGPAAVAVAGTAPTPAVRPTTNPTAVSGARRRRPVAVVAGLVLSFSVITLVGSWVLGLLDLPADALRWAGLVVLGILGVGLVFPPVGTALERPFSALGRGRSRADAGGFVLGLSLGVVFVPCAGPVLAAITVVGASHRIGPGAVVLTAAFATGVAVPLLVFALLGQRLAGRMRLVRSRAALFRKLVGVVLVVTALAIALNLTDGVQRAVPGYTDALQGRLETGASAKQALAGVTGATASGALASCTPASPVLQHCGPAPRFSGISRWLNTPTGMPLSVGGLRGRVILVDFWTYSCINCQRTLPHVEAWNRSYAKDGLTVIGIHTPEFAFEHVVSNVSQASAQLGVVYPIAIDNDYATWNAYENAYWPAEYLIDASGQVRHIDFGEGEYAQTESLIRQLLVAADPKVVLPPATDVPDDTPTEATTPESYLGYQHPDTLAGQTIEDDEMSAYRMPSSVPADEYGYGGHWAIGKESSTAGPGATLALNYQAKDVYLVLGGTGSVTVSVNGRRGKAIAVAGVPKLYQLVGSPTAQRALLTVNVAPGIQAYDFTFG